jgi:transcriptional regulator GlxA family with amidase domain
VRNIGILLFDHVDELDAIGPWEVLSFWCQQFPEDSWAATTFSRDGAMVTAAKGLRMTPDRAYADLPDLDVLVYPGGLGARQHVTVDEQLDWVREQRKKVPVMASVCTGALVFAAAGLLAGRPATTHWRSLDRLSELDGSITVRPDDRFVDHGDVVTSAGISAGIDMALHLVNRFAGAERARQVRRGIQYDPQPPV